MPEADSRYAARIEKLCAWMYSQQVDAVIIRDSENFRDSSLRYLCGHPEDASLFVFSTGTSILVAWDINLARQMASAGSIRASAEFGRDFHQTVCSILAEHPGPLRRIELQGSTAHPDYLALREKLPKTELVVRCGGLDSALADIRSIKDSREIENYHQAARHTDTVLNILHANWDSYETELDAALCIEREGRKLGAEGTGFSSIVAGPARSFAIHAFPSYSNASLKQPGLCIVDFGLVFDGYTTDITTTISRGPLSDRQKKMVELVSTAARLASEKAEPYLPVNELARAVNDFFAAHQQFMPHGLGHGIGLDAHETPFLRPTPPSDSRLEPGMIFTIEPGLYDPEHGGVRLENDFLVTETGIEQLTNSRILHLDQQD